MSEADIKILNDYLDENDGKLVSKKRFKFLQAIENLVNKHKEQEKMIELMIKATKGRWDICKDVTKCKICKNGVFVTNYCEDCLMNYLKNEVIK